MPVIRLLSLFKDLEKFIDQEYVLNLLPDIPTDNDYEAADIVSTIASEALEMLYDHGDEAMHGSVQNYNDFIDLINLRRQNLNELNVNPLFNRLITNISTIVTTLRPNIPSRTSNLDQ